MKKRIPFGVWEPDSNAVGGLGRLSEAVNVVPVKGGYRAINGAGIMNGSSPGAFTTTPISPTSVIYAYSAVNVEPISGAQSRPNVDYIFTSSGAAYSFVRNQPNTAPVVTGDIPSIGTTRDIAQYNNQIYLATGALGILGTAPICSADVTDYTDDFTAIGAGFQANSITVLRDFVVAGGIYDTTSGYQLNTVKWSAFGDGTNWTPSAATQSDIQRLNTWTGEIQRVLGGDDVFVICRNAVVLMTYTGGATIMRFDYIHDIGTQYRDSCVRVGDYVYFYSDGGFVRAGKQKGDVTYIGKGRVDEEFKRLFGDSFVSAGGFRPVAYHDQVNNGIGWMYDYGSCNVFFYSLVFDMWMTHGNGDRAGAYYVYASGLSESTNNLNSKRLKTAAWVGPDSKIYVLNEESQKAKIKVSTGYEELSPGKKSVVDKVWPIQDVRGGSQTNPELVVTSIPKLNGVNLYAEPTSTYSSTASLQSDGFFTVIGPGSYEGKFHRFQLENSDTASERTGEQALLGIDVEFFERGDY